MMILSGLSQRSVVVGGSLKFSTANRTLSILYSWDDSSFLFSAHGKVNKMGLFSNSQIPSLYQAVTKCQLHDTMTKAERAREKSRASNRQGEQAQMCCVGIQCPGIDLSPGISSAGAQVSLSDLYKHRHSTAGHTQTHSDLSSFRRLFMGI